MRTFLIIAGTTALCMASAANAQENTKGETAAPEQVQRARPDVSLDQKICVEIPPRTGSRLTITKCHSYGEWLKRGTDPLAKQH